jgi:hypothetical protein
MSTVWQPGPRPAWVQSLNLCGRPEWISLDERSLVDEAIRRTGLTDFGGDRFWEPFRIFLRALEEESQLHFAGRVIARGDLVNWLENRLTMTDWRKRHPEIDAERVERPLFITGLPRGGTSILHELLAQDPAHRAPRHWEVRYPCPPPERASYETDPRIAIADREIQLWNHIVPEYLTMHELGGAIPVECVQLMAHEFLGDELLGRHQVPSYGAWLATADMVPAYQFHKRMLQLLQWRCRGERWVLKAPSHMSTLDALLAVYPDACVVQTHRDPLTVMASVASILFSTAWVRSDAVDAQAVLSWFTGETCLHLLENAERARAKAAPGQFCDVLYADLVRRPFETLPRIYEHFGFSYRPEADAAMRAYLAKKPKGKHGGHRYDFTHTGFDRATERKRFAAYQARYGVPSEDQPK